MTVKRFFSWTPRLLLLFVLFMVFFVIGSMAVGGLIPDDLPTEPGLVSPTVGLLIIALVNVGVIAALILTSRWGGWKLALSLGFAYYGAVTFMTQMETWYFLSDITVSPELLPRLFLMGVPPAFLFIPIAVWVLGKGRATADPASNRSLVMPATQWIWKLLLIAAAYLVLYWTAGYFIAWQNPELRAFYGETGDALPFVAHTTDRLREEPLLFLFQILRSLLWVLCALPIIRGSSVNPWWMALLVGLLFSIPQNVGQILENPLMPSASIRLTHMIETALSTFIFGLIVVLLLHRKHHSLSDLLGVRKDK